MSNTTLDIAIDYIYEQLMDGAMDMKDVIMTGFKGLDNMEDDEILEWYIELKKVADE
jgi:hypothetical protein